MSTSKHIDKICIAVIILTLILSGWFISGIGIMRADYEIGYENRLFSTETVHTIDIVMDDWDSFIENCENEEYASCTVAIDGEKYANIGIRAKGNTSLSNVSSLGSQRYSLKLEFDQYESGKSYYGLDKLCLNNLIQDNTMMKDYIVYQMMNDFGVDSPLCSFVYITVNGEDWGLYLAVEGVEDSFLQRNYGSEKGELYKPDSMSFGGGRGNGKDFSFDDFDMSESNVDSENPTQFPNAQQSGEMPQNNGKSGDNSSQQFPQTDAWQSGEMPQMPQNDGESSEQFAQNNGTQKAGGNIGGGMGSDDVKLKYIDDDADSYSNIFNNAKTEITDTDKNRLIASLKNLSEYTDLENTLDTDEVLRYFVIHNFVCNGDSYTGSMIHNYYLYEEDGQLSMIPWDYNLAFGTFQGNDASGTVNTSIDSPVSGGSVDDRPMLGWIFSSEEYTEQYHKLFSEFITKWFANGELEDMIEKTAELIRPYVESDPTKFCTTEEFDTGVSAIKQFVALRSEAVSKQLDGDGTLVDTTGLNLSDMGTMSAGGNSAFGGKTKTDDSQTLGGGENASENTQNETQPNRNTQSGTQPSFNMPSGNESNGNEMKQSFSTATENMSFVQNLASEETQGAMQTPPDMSGQQGGMQIPPDMSGQQGGMQAPPDMSGQQGEMQMPNMPTETDGSSVETNGEEAQSNEAFGQNEGSQPNQNFEKRSDDAINNASEAYDIDTSNLMLVGISLVVLLLGICFAVKFKY